VPRFAKFDIRASDGKRKVKKVGKSKKSFSDKSAYFRRMSISRDPSVVTFRIFPLSDENLGTMIILLRGSGCIPKTMDTRS
jgi:hypothetical protein